MFYIEELDIKGYIRLALNQFERIHLKFTEKIQVIIGTNGSGKSSLFAELSPMPGEKANFHKNGHKIITIRSNKKRYVLSTTFTPNQHSFKEDGVELNLDGTITEQKKLVFKYFGITAAIHALSIGEHSFHSMSSNDRRDWFRLLCDTNYDYAISVFNRIRERARDNQGALKLARNKLVELSTKVMSREQFELIEKESEQLYQVVQHLIENKSALTAPLDQTQTSIDQKMQYIEQEAHKLQDLIIKAERLIRAHNIEDPKSISNLNFFVMQQLEELKQRKNQLFVEHNEHRSIVDQFEKTKLFQAANISSIIESLKKEKDKLKSDLIYQFDTVDVDLYIDKLSEFSDKLLTLALDIPINEGSTKYTRELFKQYNIVKENLTVTIANHEAKSRELDERLIHLKDHQDNQDITCPECRHTWKPFTNQVMIDDLTKRLIIIAEDISRDKKLLEDTNFKINEFNHWVSYIEAIKDLASQYAYMRDYWGLIMKKEVLFEKPRSIAMITNMYKDTLFKERAIKKIDEQLQQEYSRLDLMEQQQGKDYNQSSIILQRINDELSSIATKESHLHSLKDVTRSLTDLLEEISGVNANVEGSYKAIEGLTERFLEDYRRTLYNDVLRSFQSDLAIKEKMLQDERVHNHTVKTLESEIGELEDNQEAYKLLVKELSPTEGIIAEGLFGYMKMFVRRMNKFIAAIWSYPLVIQPCSAEEGKIELNYKFPLLVNDSTALRADVKNGSSSMREVVNLAFTVNALETIGLGQNQLFLDEFGSAMDPVHKRQTAQMINDIAINRKFSQIFLISHDIAQYSSLDHTEICVLNNANVIIPTGCTYNQHVTLE
jgi:ABC-type hemin transport system ATPase subunit